MTPPLEFLPMAVSAIPLALLGAVLGLDVVSFPQAMISRPLAAATLAGALVGHPGYGLIAGAMLELFALETLPFGASRYPEWGSASVVGGALFALQPVGSPGALTIAVCAALLTAWLGSWTMVWHRRLIARWAAGMRGALASGSGEAVIALQLKGLTSDAVRGGALTWVALVVFVPLERLILAHWSFNGAESRAAVVICAGAVAGGAIWKLAHNTTGAKWFLLGGVAVGSLLLAVT
jgi:mannose/fructose/N-acetylgalactosamine-specific phosphotransferase system component IIC